MDSALAIVDKRRSEMNVAEVMNVIGDVKGRTCLVIDDLIDTAGTLVKTASALMENGASQVYACASHPVLSGPAVQNISQSCITEVVVTNTIPLSEGAEAGTENQSAYYRWPDRTCDPVDSRRNVGQQTVLIGMENYGNRN